MSTATEVPVKSCAYCGTTTGDMENHGRFAGDYWLCRDVARCVTSAWEEYLASKTPAGPASGAAPQEDPAVPPAGNGQPVTAPEAEQDGGTP